MLCLLRSARSAAVALCLTFVASQPLSAQEQPGKTAPPPAAKSISLEINPTASIDELLKQIEAIRSAPTTGKTREDQVKEVFERFGALDKAADLVMSKQPSNEQRQAAVSVKFQVYEGLLQMNQRTAVDRLAEFAARVANDSFAPIAEQGRYYVFQSAMVRVDPAKPESFALMFKAAQDYVHFGKFDVSRARTAYTAAQVLEGQEQYGLAAEAYSEFAEKFEKSGATQFVRLAGLLRSAAERMKLVGEPLELAGKTIDGEEFDWSKYKDKVVLVDFWASWCGPCLAEMPNIAAAYGKYKARGFEIVGVNLDTPDELPAAKEVLTKLAQPKLPAATPLWENLVADSEATSGWEHPLAKKYGVSAIPAVILVGRDGNVVTFRARGDELVKQLDKLLGK